MLKRILDWRIASALAFVQVIYDGTRVRLAGSTMDDTRERRQALMIFPEAATKPKFSTYNAHDARDL